MGDEELHMHDHGHEHAHGHHHHHGSDSPEGMSEQDKRKALLTYLISHNEHHAEEIREMAESLAADGCEAAAELVKAASLNFSEGNEKLREALAMLQRG